MPAGRKFLTRLTADTTMHLQPALIVARVTRSSNSFRMTGNTPPCGHLNNALPVGMNTITRKIAATFHKPIHVRLVELNLRSLTMKAN